MTLEGFNKNNNLSGEVNKALYDGKIDSQEAKFMVEVLNKFRRQNVKISQKQLLRLSREMRLPYGIKLANRKRIGRKLEMKIRERALERNISTPSKNLRKKIRNESMEVLSGDLEKYTQEFKKYRGTINGPKTLTKSCKTLGIPTKNLQRILGVKVDGDIGYRTYKAFTEKIGIIKNGKIEKASEQGEVQGNVIEIAKRYLNKTEKNLTLREDINRTIKKLDGRSFNIKSTPWCAAFIRMLLVKSGNIRAAKNMTNTALSALGINQIGYHIGIHIGGGKFIDGNSGKQTDRVSSDSIHRGYRKRGFVGWVLPQDIGNRRKVKGNRNPPPGAILVFGRGGSKVAPRKAKIARKKLGIA